MVMEEKKSIQFSTEKELRIFLLPLRQRLLHEMAVIGIPVTGKQLADRLKITPSSAHHHIKQLQSIGLIEFDHTELINGITARYVRLADVNVKVGLEMNDLLSSEREAIVKNLINNYYAGFSNALESIRTQKIPDNRTTKNPLNDIVTDVIHLTNEEAEEFYQLLRNFMNAHTKPKHGTKPWDIMMIAYCSELVQNDEI